MELCGKLSTAFLGEWSNYLEACCYLCRQRLHLACLGVGRTSGGCSGGAADSQPLHCCRIFSVWALYKKTWLQWLAALWWKRLRLVSLPQSWAGVTYTAASLSSPLLGKGGKASSLKRIGIKNGTRKITFFWCVAFFLLWKLLFRSDSCSPEVNEQCIDTAWCIHHTDVWQLAASEFLVAKLQQAKGNSTWSGASSFWIQAMPWATAACSVASLQALRPVLQFAGRMEKWWNAMTGC